MSLATPRSARSSCSRSTPERAQGSRSRSSGRTSICTTSSCVFRRSSTNGIVGPTKSGKERKVPLTATLEAALRGIRHVKGPRVFCNPDGTPLTLWQLHERLWGACRRAGLRRIRWHDCRHSFASQLVIGGHAASSGAGVARPLHDHHDDALRPPRSRRRPRVPLGARRESLRQPDGNRRRWCRARAA